MELLKHHKKTKVTSERHNNSPIKKRGLRQESFLSWEQTTNGNGNSGMRERKREVYRRSYAMKGKEYETVEKASVWNYLFTDCHVYWSHALIEMVTMGWEREREGSIWKKLCSERKRIWNCRQSESVELFFYWLSCLLITHAHNYLFIFVFCINLKDNLYLNIFIISNFIH